MDTGYVLHNVIIFCTYYALIIPQSITNSFQGILITDGDSSYAVFIYECGGVEWGGGVIGWQANSSHFEEHFLSDKPDSDVIGCWYSDTYSAIVYRLDSKTVYIYTTLYTMHGY